MKQRKEVLTEFPRPRDVNGDGEHHDLHHPHRRHDQAAYVHALFMLQAHLGMVRLVGLRIVANGGELGEELGELDDVRVPSDA